MVPPLVGRYGLEACSCQARKEGLSSGIGSFPQVFSPSLSLQTISTLLLKITPQGFMSKWLASGQHGPVRWTIFSISCFSTQHFHYQKFQLETPALMSWAVIHLLPKILKQNPFFKTNMILSIEIKLDLSAEG